MPQIKIRGIAVEQVQSISKELVNELQQVIGCPEEDLTLEWIPATTIANGHIVAGYPFVEVAWFDRGQEIQNRVAKSITRFIQKTGHENVDIMFTVFEKNRYYENGEHF